MYNVNTDLYAFGTDLWRQDSELTFEAVCTLWCPFDEPVRRYVYNIWCGFVVYKTELIWTGTKHNLSKIPGFGCAFTLGGAHAHVAQSDDVRVLGVQLSSDLSLDKHVNVVSAKCCFQLRQLRSIRHSLGDDPVAALVHAFVASRVDYCGSLLIGAPRKTTDSCNVPSTRQHESSREHAQVRPGTHSFLAKSATLAGCCRPGSVQSLRPDVQKSAQDGS